MGPTLALCMEQMKRTKPSITVLMAAYNSEKYIPIAIESILNQTYKNFELIIIDDCSKDNTCTIIKKYAKKDKRIIAYRNQKNIKSCQTLINGMKLAKGKYIAIMDNDDWSYPYRLEKQYNYLESHPKVGVIGGTLVIMNENGNVFAQREYNLTNEAIRKMLFKHSPFAHPLIMLRKSVLQEVGYYDPDFAPADDYELYFRIGKVSEFANLPDKLLKYRVLSNSITNKSTKIMELKTILIRNKYKNSIPYKMSISDYIYNTLQYWSIFLIPSKFKIKLFNLVRNSKIK